MAQREFFFYPSWEETGFANVTHIIINIINYHGWERTLLKRKGGSDVPVLFFPAFFFAFDGWVREREYKRTGREGLGRLGKGLTRI